MLLKLSQSSNDAPSYSIPVIPASYPPLRLLTSKYQLDDPNYSPEMHTPFEKGSPTPFSFLAECFDLVSQQKGNNSQSMKKLIIKNMFESIILTTPEDMLPVYNICIGKVAPDFIKSEMNIGDSILQKSISKSTGRSLQQIRDSMVSLGDLGQVAMKSSRGQSRMDMFLIKKKDLNASRLSARKVYDTCKRMSFLSGNKVETEKEVLILKMLNDSEGSEAQYIIRYIQGNLKIGAAEVSMQSALAKAFFNKLNKNKKLNDQQYNEKLDEFEKKLKQAYCEYPDQEMMINCLLKMENLQDLQKIMHITQGIPCKPMLAKPTKEIAIIFKRFENMRFTCEYKYDGLRGQIHSNQGNIQIFSRNLQNMTETYPDIAQILASSEKIPKNYIVDCEIVAIDPITHRILPFQTLSNRQKKNVTNENIQVSICLFLFDILYIENKSLLQEPLSYRRQVLKQSFAPVQGQLQFVTSSDSQNIEDIQEVLLNSIKDGCEGLMIKTLDELSFYQPAKRSFKWLKLKKDYMNNGIGDSLDLVPIGAFYGQGKRSGFYGSYLLACYNEELERFENCCKIGTGFSDVQLEEFYEYYKDKRLPGPRNDYCVGEFQCDVWLDANQVWEIRGADIQVSPVYQCAVERVKGGRGLGIRFPRLIQIRNDKKLIEATSDEFIYDLYKQQAQVVNMDFESDNDIY